MSIAEQNRLGDLLKYEADKNYSREVETVVAGQKMQLGTIVGRKTESGEIKEISVAEGESDGSDIAVGVLLEDVDATKKSCKSLIVARDAIVADSAVIFPQNASEDQKKKIKKDLEARGIVIRKSA